MSWMPLDRVERAVVVCLACFGPVLGLRADQAKPVDLSSEQYRISRWRADSGLPQNTVRAMARTRDGYLWLGTLKGLARFDGLRFETFDHSTDPLLAHDSIDELVEDTADGSLWIRAGQDLLHYKSHEFKKLGAQDGFPTIDGPLWPGGPGRVWFTPQFGQVGLIHGGSVTVRQFGSPLEANKVLELIEAGPSKVFLLFSSGLCALDFNTGTLTRLTMPRKLAVYSCLARELDGTLWVGATDGVWFGDGTNWTKLTEPAALANRGKPVQIHATASGNIWLVKSGEPNGLGHWQRTAAGQLIEREIPELGEKMEIERLLEDNEGNLWLGTKAGLYRLQTRRLKVFSKRNNLRSDDVITLAQGGDGTIWAGTAEGLSCIREGMVFNLPLPPRDSQWGRIESFLIDHQNRLWVGTRPEALSRYQNGKWEYVDLPDGVKSGLFLRAFYEDHQGRIWISTGQGVVCNDSGHCVFYSTNNGLSCPDVRVIFQDRAQDIWFGTYGGGLNRLHGGKITNYCTTRGSYNNRAWWIHEDPDGVFWVGSEDGLNRFVPPGVQARQAQAHRGLRHEQPPTSESFDHGKSDDGAFFTFTLEHGLRDVVINNIQEDQFGSLWLSTLHGIFRVSRKELNEVASGRQKKVQCVAFGEADGMFSSECNGGDNQPSGCKDDEGRIWFPTAEGIVMIDPKLIQHSEVPPPVVIERIIADDEVIFGDGFNQTKPMGHGENSTIATPGKTGEYRLPASRRRALEFQYTSTSLVAPEAIKFRYRLVGYDRDWRDADENRRAYYNNLHPKHYQFEVKAMNSYGISSPTAGIFPFSVEPHFWETWVFYILCACTAIGMALAVQAYRLRWQHRLLKLEEQRALANERTRIARDLHDDLGTALTGLALQLDVAGREAAATPPLVGRLNDTARQARDLAERMREVVWTVNPKCDTVSSLANFLEQQVSQFLRLDGTRVRLDFPDDIPDMPAGAKERHQLALAVREALTNVMRHARATEVVLSLALREQYMQVQVRDNGCGFNTSEKTGQGLENMRERLELVGGRFECHSEPGKGTVVTFMLPLGVSTGAQNNERS